jgi:hypothetical protein
MKAIAFLLALTISGYSYSSEGSLVLEAISRISAGSKVGTKTVVKSAIKSSDGLPEQLVKEMLPKKFEFYFKTKSGMFVIVEKNPFNNYGMDMSEAIKITSVKKIAAPVGRSAEATPMEKAIKSELEAAGIKTEKTVGFDNRNSGVFVGDRAVYYRFEEAFILKEALQEMDLGTLENVLEKLSRL